MAMNVRFARPVMHRTMHGNDDWKPTRSSGAAPEVLYFADPFLAPFRRDALHIAVDRRVDRASTHEAENAPLQHLHGMGAEPPPVNQTGHAHGDDDAGRL